MPCTRNSASVESAGVLLEDAHEQLADRLALGLRLGDAGEPLEEPVAGVDVDQLDALVAAERLDDLVALASAHQPGVDVDARELVTDRLVDQRRGDGGVDAAAQRRRSPVASPTWARTAATCVVDDRVHRPRRRAAGEVVEEALQHGHPVRRVHDLGMELHAPDLARVVSPSAATGASARATPWR